MSSIVVENELTGEHASPALSDGNGGRALSVLHLDQGPLLLNLRSAGMKADGDHRLRVAIVVDGILVQEWIKDLVIWFRSIHAFDVRLFACEASPQQTRLQASTLFRCSYAYSRRIYDPFRDVTLASHDAILELPSSDTDRAHSVTKVNPEYIADVILWLACAPLPSGSSINLARFGVLSVQFGLNQHFPPYWDEASRGDLLSQATVWWHASHLGRARPLRTANVRTDQGLAFTRNSEQPLNAIAQMTTSICAEIFSDNEGWLSKAKAIPEESLPPPQWANKAPSALQTASFTCRKALRSLALRIQRLEGKLSWFIALRKNDSRSYVQSGRLGRDGLNKLPLPPGSQMADPFLLEHKNRTYLYFEEIPAGTTKGRLSCAEVRDDGSIGNPTVVLEADGHLSYPCVFNHGGEIFMIPESSYSRRVDLYRADGPASEFKLERTYIDDLAAVDTTPVVIDGRWYFFTTTTEPFMQTLLFWSERLDGAWHLHPKSPVSCSAQNSRSAGAIKFVNGRILRPVQDCSKRYGYAIVVNEVRRLTPTDFEECTVDVILPKWRQKLVATHTWNFNAKFEVFDGRAAE